MHFLHFSRKKVGKNQCGGGYFVVTVKNCEVSCDYFSHIYLMEARSSPRRDDRERGWKFRMENQGESNHRKLEKVLASPKGPTKVKDETKTLKINRGTSLVGQ